MTAAGLLELLNLHGCEPAAVACDFGPELEYAAPAPPGAEAFVPMLRTGVVLILARRRWYGLAADGHAFELSPRAAIPPAAMYLAAERRAGDPEAGCWDAVQPRHRRLLRPPARNRQAARHGQSRMNGTVTLTAGDWLVWSRPHRRQRWRVVASAPTMPAAARVMFDLMTGKGGDWLVTAPDALDPNIRPAHLRG